MGEEGGEEEEHNHVEKPASSLLSLKTPVFLLSAYRLDIMPRNYSFHLSSSVFRKMAYVPFYQLTYHLRGKDSNIL